MIKRSNLIPVVFWIVGTTLVVLLSERERDAERQRLALETRITGEQVELRLESCLQSRVALVRTLSRSEWADSEDLFARWPQRAEPLIGLFPGVQALNFVDVDSVIRVVVPEEPNHAAKGVQLFDNPNPSVVLALSRASAGTLTRTDPIELLQSGTGFTVYDRIESSDGSFLGYANGVFRVDDLMRACLFETRFEETFQLALYEATGQVPFYVKPVRPAPMPWEMAETLEVSAADRPWRMILARHPESLESAGRGTATLILFFGVSIVSLAAFLLALLLANQRSLRESQQRYRFLIENQNDFVIQFDLENRLTYVSPSFCDSQGEVASKLLGTSFVQLIDVDGRGSFVTIREEVASPPHNANCELRTRTVFGYRWIAWSFAGVTDDAGKVALVNGTGRDLTDLRLMEERIAHSEKMKALGEMAGGITHDFNNQLQVMLGNIEFLARSASDEQREQFEQIEGAILRAMNLTGKLATLSRQQSVDHRSLELAAFIQEIADLLRHSLPTTISVQVDVPDSSMMVMADPSQIEQVLLNLAFNAKDSIDTHGSIRITLLQDTLDHAFCRTHPEVEPGEFARLSVSDNGAGIPVSVLPRIFDPFFTTKGVGDGHGLGLSNCDSIVRQHGGIILAESDEGYGSTFTVYLPIAGSQSAVEEKTVPERDSNGAGNNLILIIDDDDEVRKLNERILASAGYQTISAANGYDGVVIFEERQDEIRMVIMDLVMPVMDGREAVQRIRAISSSVYILFSSGYVPADDGEQMLSEPLLRKPFKSKELLAFAAEAGGTDRR